MYIEFKLPVGTNGTTPAHALDVIRDKLNNWAAKYEVEYKTKLYKYTLRVTFDSDDIYTLFGVTWVPCSRFPSWTNYRLISDLNNKT
jgi:hypothetical protein